MSSSILRDRKICQVCKKSFSNEMALRGHMMSCHTQKRSAPNAESSASGSTLPSIESRSPLTAVEEAGLILVAMSKGERPENSENWNAIDRFLAAPKDKEEYYQTDLDSDDDNKNVKYKSMAELLASNVGEEDSDNDADDETYLVEREEKCKKTFKCDLCGKVLGSYQALGGHRTGHKNKRVKICHDKNDQDRRYMCEVCGRVFESGQALGGHMKTHFF
ncbi:hypothetical protein N665_1266s0002 [Sinapis alba]|nr:hypothetical protein N665_1266s0002 [Sinapis alba]